MAEPKEGGVGLQHTMLSKLLQGGVTEEGLRRSLDAIHRMDPAFRSFLSIRVGDVFLPLQLSLDCLERELSARMDEPLVVPPVAPGSSISGLPPVDEPSLLVTVGGSKERTIQVPCASLPAVGPGSGGPKLHPAAPTVGSGMTDAPAGGAGPMEATPTTGACGICGVGTKSLRTHVEQVHLPWWFNPVSACFKCKNHHRNSSALLRHIDRNHDGDGDGCLLNDRNYHSYIQGMVRMLKGLAGACGFMSTHQLIHLVTSKGLTPNTGTHVQGFGQKLLADVALAMGEPFVGKLTLHPPSHPVAILQWETLYNVLAHLKSQELTGNVRNCPASLDDTPDLSSERFWPESVDAHCHLRLAVSRSGQEASAALTQWSAGVVGHRVSSVVDNRVFPDSDWRGPFPPELRFESAAGRSTLRVYYTFGIHPRWEPDTKVLAQLEGMVSKPQCVGIGEVGLDRTCPSAVWPSQGRVLRKAAELARELNKPLVLHLRPDGEVTMAQLQSEAVGILRSANLAFRHPIHLHCYTGCTRDLHAWRKAFPCSRLGISSRTLETPEGRAMVRSVDLEQALIETDSPYLGSKSPWGLLRVAQELGRLRNLPTRVVLLMSTSAAKCLYGIA